MAKGKAIEYRKLSELKKLGRNPRKISPESFEKLCRSIQDNLDYFEARPVILSDRTGELVIIAGNQRYDAAKKIGMKEVPTFLLSGLTEEKEKEIIIRDNVSNGEWDYSILNKDYSTEDLTSFGVEVNTGEMIASAYGSKEEFQESLVEYPITIISNHNEFETWKKLREKYGIEDNTKLFFKILSLHDKSFLR